MAFQGVFDATRASIQDSLDDVASSRTSSKTKLQALKNLERNLAMACCGTDAALDAKDSFLGLQYTFECNIPSRLLSCIATSTVRLEAISNKGTIDAERTAEAQEITTQLLLMLTIIQGVVLNHEPSKAYMGRKVNLETLLDLLFVSRHLSPPAQPQDVKPHQSENLTSVVIDTLLCVLVDSSASLRAFEQANGVQVVVKILKRAGTPREVRMRCLEFLYFYLLDETPSAIPTEVQDAPTIVEEPPSSPRASPPPQPVVPATPIAPRTKPYLNATPLRPTGRFPSSSGASGKDSLASSTSSRSTSGGSARSFNSSTSNHTTSTAMSSPSTSPQKVPVMVLPPAQYRFPPPKSPIKQRLATPHQSKHQSPPTSPPPSNSNSSTRFPQLRSMMMLKKEIDYTPQSPIKRSHSGQQTPAGPGTPASQGPGLGHPRRPGHAKTQSLVTGLPSQATSRMYSIVSRADTDEGSAAEINRRDLGMGKGKGKERGQDGNWKTTEEKKELLGTMLGNVDALVEGVRKAGIWGLS